MLLVSKTWCSDDDGNSVECAAKQERPRYKRCVLRFFPRGGRREVRWDPAIFSNTVLEAHVVEFLLVALDLLQIPTCSHELPCTLDTLSSHGVSNEHCKHVAEGLVVWQRHFLWRLADAAGLISVKGYCKVRC